MQELVPARIQLDETGTPYAPDFADCYFSRQDGLAETRHVFLSGNHLPQRWRGKGQFVIAETGFGSGLNFLATWQAWRADPQRCGRLHFISIEKHPIAKQALRELLAAWPELQPFAAELLENYPPLLAGFHRLTLGQGRVTLTLCFMDVQEALAELVARVDAWYLDGFAPARNPAMWALPVMQAIADLSQAGATLATFTVAGDVRRHLQAAGFTVEKRKGFGKKREMLAATAGGISPVSQLPAWFALPEPAAGRRASIIGGGVAGCQIAHALAQRGWRVVLLERHARLALEASGNRAGVLTPKMTAEAGWGERFYRQAFLFALRQLRQLEAAGHDIDWAQCGALQLAHEPREAARQQAIRARGLPEDFVQILEVEEAAAIAGVPLSVGASHFPQAGWLNPASLCAALTAHDNIEVRTLTQADAVPTDGVTVIASGREAGQFGQSAFLPFLPVMGQTSRAQASDDSAKLKTALGHEGYLTPAVAGRHIFGATFVRNVREAFLDAGADAANFRQLAHYLPALAALLGTVESSHAAIRMTTPDRYPVVGALPDVAFFQEAYADLQHGRARQAFPAAQYQAGLSIMAGFGSRGLTTSGLCAEVLAAQLSGEPLPLQATLYGSLHPARFLIRQCRRG
ncbi:bifunctional tRNA (5-methylaminomethyl-2-thiouridine)(34)-methyltransferase MnmD/FAD-dependent 5-carboxymethylaminomethyl-2-thiouridine(34) oxidoreductase MnmC [Candidatus Thiothrix sp. Deng01]|uniref:tRNA 5-methylaminomethyl-2-thiouridine biosynthesis bifunctional protein MnmC n=1 Tax=Candidatus Thiothrix phosphatis TaxID=3112415 RepID=A0ABU6CTH9_9GAMM|nr:bifunctional tRNA (5-methylaminomethyl-2-thiouridine)(34)-methyltransferase MnmD/FAD-dependent 5-carboxymethylaminomethyl-2-thiouridine(34) oxidoreductase MnmC [Candidatus Thiothrix sp. Deng01]MEB4590054.1 bifunctional tRNA (5-methylaminomethyl-2-thiouridine)(34)-methyltransferase MnmD/FAD-dependent 5-carboxymethylaminomethyl-2-thiouridine(34) oxidoreductase MnmC [Candidatus Thiothrix sp. Deng01]